MGKIILSIAGVIFAGYGLVCLADPGIALGAAGLAATSADGTAEAGAMYGGFQTGFGLFCLLCAWQSALQRAGLLALLIGIGSLALARSWHALSADGALTAYTWGAIAFELLVAALAAVALLRPRPG